MQMYYLESESWDWAAYKQIWDFLDVTSVALGKGKDFSVIQLGQWPWATQICLSITSQIN